VKPYGTPRPLKAQPVGRALGEGWIKSRIIILPRRAGDEVLFFLLLGAVIAGTMILPIFERLPFDACMFYKSTGLPCPGCGSTRAFVSMGHGMFAKAWAYNPSAVVLYILVVFRWLVSVPCVIKPLRLRIFSPAATTVILLTYLFLHVVHGAVRLMLVANGVIDWPPQF